MRLALILVAALLVAAACVWLVFGRRGDHDIRAADRPLSDLTPQALESEIRSTLRLGTSPSVVEEFLKKRGIEYSYDAGNNMVYATARHLKGSNIVTTECLALKFHFDSAPKLTSIDARVTYIGP